MKDKGNSLVVYQRQIASFLFTRAMHVPAVPLRAPTNGCRSGGSSHTTALILGRPSLTTLLVSYYLSQSRSSPSNDVFRKPHVGRQLHPEKRKVMLKELCPPISTALSLQIP
jgi:hypothetical protein